MNAPQLILAPRPGVAIWRTDHPTAVRPFYVTLHGRPVLARGYFTAPAAVAASVLL